MRLHSRAHSFAANRDNPMKPKTYHTTYRYLNSIADPNEKAEGKPTRPIGICPTIRKTLDIYIYWLHIYYYCLLVDCFCFVLTFACLLSAVSRSLYVSSIFFFCLIQKVTLNYFGPRRTNGFRCQLVCGVVWLPRCWENIQREGLSGHRFKYMIILIWFWHYHSCVGQAQTKSNAIRLVVNMNFMHF